VKPRPPLSLLFLLLPLPVPCSGSPALHLHLRFSPRTPETVAGREPSRPPVPASCSSFTHDTPFSLPVLLLLHHSRLQAPHVSSLLCSSLPRHATRPQAMPTRCRRLPLRVAEPISAQTGRTPVNSAHAR